MLFIRVAFRNGKDVVFERSVGSTGEETIVRAPEGTHAHPTGMAADGRHLIYEGEEDATDVWGLQLTDDRKARAYVQSPSFETQGALSADGRWLAFTSDLSGRFEVYAQSSTQQQLSYDVTADGQRFIVSAVARRTDPSINVLLNWPSLVASSRP